MNRNRVALVLNLQAFLSTCCAQELYLIARALTGELETRAHDARLEAAALCCALLPDAQREHAAIFSGDCSTAPADA
jgi:hypothetical protein